MRSPYKNRMAIISLRQSSFYLVAATVLLSVGGVSSLRAQIVPVNNPTVPPPVTIVTVTPGDPGDPGFPPASESTPPATTTAPTEPKDMKDVKDMKSSVTYNAGCGDYFELFITGSGTFGDMGHANDPGHFDFDRAQGNLGFEYHFAQDWTVGTILSYAHVDSSYGNLDASTTTDSYLPTLFVSYYHEGWWARLSTTDGYDTFTEQRGTPTGQANGAGDGWQYGGKLTKTAGESTTCTSVTRTPTPCRASSAACCATTPKWAASSCSPTSAPAGSVSMAMPASKSPATTSRRVLPSRAAAFT